MQFPTDCTVWKQLSDNAREIEGLSPIERDYSARSFLYLEQVLGKDFLKRIEKTSHPLNYLIANFVPWTRHKIVRFADALRTVSGSVNFDLFVDSLEDYEKFSHNLLVVEGTAKLVNDGLQATFEPTLPVSNNQKQPDVKLEHAATGETLYMEFAIQNSSRGAQEAFDAMDAISSRFMRLGVNLLWAGRMFKTPAVPHLRDLAIQLDNAISRAQSEECFVDMVEEGTCEIAVCPDTARELMERWCSARGLQTGQFQGPPYNDNTVERLKRKLEKEQRQLPKGVPNAILILDTDAFFRAREIRSLINDIEEEVFKYPHVSIAIIQGQHLAGLPPEVVQKGEHRYTRKRVDDVYTQECLTLLNRYSPMPLSAAVMSKFLRAF